MKNAKAILLTVVCLLLVAGTVGTFDSLRANDILIVGVDGDLVTVSPNAITWWDDGDIQFSLVYADGVLKLATGDGKMVAMWRNPG